MKTKFLLSILACIFLFSCSTSKENALSLFKDLKENEGVLTQSSDKYQIHIQPDDELIITVSSQVPEATAKFNIPINNPATRSPIETSVQPQLQTYIVNSEGDISFPVLGTLHVQGKTTEEVEKMIKIQVEETVNDPYVHVKMANFTVNVMGEVKEPQRVAITSQKFSLLDALAAAGDLTEYARRDNVMVIRNKDGKTTYHRLNLNNSNIFASPYFYMQQNDVVLVEPNAIKVDNSKYNQYSAFKLSTISTVVSMTSVIASLLIALLIKK